MNRPGLTHTERLVFIWLILGFLVASGGSCVQCVTAITNLATSAPERPGGGL